MSDFAVGDRVICFDDFGAVGDHGVIRWIESTGLVMVDFDDGQSWVTERHQLAREELTDQEAPAWTALETLLAAIDAMRAACDRGSAHWDGCEAEHPRCKVYRASEVVRAEGIPLAAWRAITEVGNG